MNSLLGAFVCTLVLQPQEPKAPPSTNPPAPATQPAAGKTGPGAGPATNPAQQTPPRINNVEFDKNGYPIVPDDRDPAPPPPARPAGETARPDAAASAAPAARPSAQEARTPRTDAPSAAPAFASGMAAGSPLLDVFQHTRSPGVFKGLGGVTVWWRVTIYDPQGAAIGYRELTQTSDCSYAERDRLEYAHDGRVYGRSGPSVFAESRGRPWPTLVEAAGQELALFGMQLRLPWCFGEAASYVVTGRDTVDRPDGRLQRIKLERRPPSALDSVGPELDPRPRDRFELLYEPAGGRPRELVHRFANGDDPGTARRVLLDDWAEFQGVPYPRRRLYVDDSQRPTTLLEITNLQAATITERDFRMQ